MVCQNCQSTDIVKIQEQFYCINCGQLVVAPRQTPAAAPKAAAPVKASAPIATAVVSPPKVATPAPKPKIPLPAKPAPVAMPQSGSTIIINHKSKVAAPKTEDIKVSDKLTSSKQSIAIAPPKSNPALGLSRKMDSLKTRSKAKIDNVISKPTLAKAPTANSSSVGGTSRRVSDILLKPRQITPPNLPKPSAALVSATTPALPAKATAPRRVPPTNDLTPFGFAWQAIVSRAYYQFALPIGGLLVVTLAAMSLISSPAQISSSLLNLSQLNSSQYEILLKTTFAAIAGLALIYFYRLYSQSAVSYGAAKLLDSRPVSQAKWSDAGRSGFWGVARLDAIATGFWVILIIAELLLIKYWAYGGIEPSYIRIAGLVVAHSLVIYLGLGLLATRRLSFFPTVLTNTRPLDGWRFGWKLYRRHFGSIMNAGLIIVLTNAIFAAAAIGAVTGLVFASRLFTNSPLAPAVVVAGSLVVLLFATTTMTVFNSAYWLQYYHLLVSRIYPAQRLKLWGDGQGQTADGGGRLALSLLPLVWGAVFLALWLYQGQMMALVARI